jgi:ComF family protein
MLPRPKSAALSADCELSVAALEYLWPVDQLVQELKFGGSWPVARCFGSLIGEARRDHPQPLPQAIVPIPLHPYRLAERGFNQAEHIARFAAESLGLPLANQLLRRRRHTIPQSRLDAAARRNNLRGAFEISGPSAKQTATSLQRVALVDDVQTTGSTLLAASKALRGVGVQHIEWWCAARVSS